MSFSHLTLSFFFPYSFHIFLSLSLPYVSCYPYFYFFSLTSQHLTRSVSLTSNLSIPICQYSPSLSSFFFPLFSLLLSLYCPFLFFFCLSLSLPFSPILSHSLPLSLSISLFAIHSRSLSISLFPWPWCVSGKVGCARAHPQLATCFGDGTADAQSVR